MCVYLQLVLIDLALQDDVGRGSGEGGRPADARRVAHAEAHAFGQLHVLLLRLQSPQLGLRTPLAGLRVPTFSAGEETL